MASSSATNYDYNPHQMIFECPYNPEHSFQQGKMFQHITKCRNGWIKTLLQHGVEPWQTKCLYCGMEHYPHEASYHYKRCAHYDQLRAIFGPKPIYEVEEKPKEKKEVPTGILIEL